MSLSKNSQYYFNLINKQQRCLGTVLPSGGVISPVSENRCWAFYFPAVFTLGIGFVNVGTSLGTKIVEAAV